jgi:HD-like signal output (HDOD) protein
VTAFAEGVHLPVSWVETLNTHSVQTAQLATRLSAGKPWSAQSFTAGLLHEVGQLVLATSRPDEFGTIVGTWRGAAESAAAAETRDPAEVIEPLALSDLELAELGTSHGDAGAGLLSLWGLPVDIVDAAARHATGDMPTTAGDLCSAVALAHAMVEAQRGPVCGAHQVKPFDDELLGAHERTVIQRWRTSLEPRD